MGKRVVINLQEVRAARDSQVVIVDFDGREHVLNPLTLEGYLEIINIQERYTALRGNPAPADIAAVMGDVQAIIKAAIPTFPVGGLRPDELFLVINAIQERTTGSEEGAGESQTGEAAS